MYRLQEIICFALCNFCISILRKMLEQPEKNGKVRSFESTNINKKICERKQLVELE
jgi:hypothetical protein